MSIKFKFCALCLITGFLLLTTINGQAEENATSSDAESIEEKQALAITPSEEEEEDDKEEDQEDINTTTILDDD